MTSPDRRDWGLQRDGVQVVLMMWVEVDGAAKPWYRTNDPVCPGLLMSHLERSGKQWVIESRYICLTDK